jgi:hypothetical protein
LFHECGLSRPDFQQGMTAGCQDSWQKPGQAAIGVQPVGAGVQGRARLMIAYFGRQ